MDLINRLIFKRMLGFGFIGICCAMLHISSLTLLISFFNATDAGLQLYLNVLTFFLSGAINFIVNDRIVYSKLRFSSVWKRFVKFGTIVIFQGVVIFGISNGVLRVVGIDSAYLYAALILTLGSFLLKFFLVDNWIYDGRRTSLAYATSVK